MGPSEGVVVATAAGVGTVDDPNAKTAGAADVGAGPVAVDGALNPNPLADALGASLLANGYGGGAEDVDPNANGDGAVVAEVKPKENPPLDAVEAVVTGAADEPNENIELELAGVVALTADVVAGRPNTVDGAVGAPNTGGAVVFATDGVGLKAGADVEGVEAPKTVDPPKLNGVDADGLKSDEDGVEVGVAAVPAEKLKVDDEDDDVVEDVVGVAETS